MEDFNKVKAYINGQLRNGDVKAIVSKAGKTQPVFASAMRKDIWASLTDSEKKVITKAVQYLKQRETKEAKALENISNSL